MDRILLLNGLVVNEGRRSEVDLLVTDGRIERIGGDLSAVRADILIDASDKLVLPGLIDDQVHFREPGLTHKGDIASESRAAVAGGVTSFLDMPNTQPPTTTSERLQEKYAVAARTSRANFGFYFGATNDNIEAIRVLDPQRVCGLKVFMGASTGNLLVDSPEALEAIFRNSPLLIATHCEDTPTIKENERRFRELYGEAIPMHCHPLIRSEEACFKSSSLAVDLARRYGSRLHLLHLSTARELALLSRAPLTEKRITAEACVHHLYFQASDYQDKGALLKCNPAIKTQRDREALRRAVIEGSIDVIATDHAPHTLCEKQGSYFTVAAGLPLVQHTLYVLWDLHCQGIFPLELIVEKTSHAVARLFGIKERGFVREGYWADLVVVDPRSETAVTPMSVLYKCGWSPFLGRTFPCSIDTTIVSGQIAYRRRVAIEDVLGRCLEFESADRP
ncbi:MAG: dihydroorotase [Gammaproteobacteria bacterium]